MDLCMALFEAPNFIEYELRSNLFVDANRVYKLKTILTLLSKLGTLETGSYVRVKLNL